MPTTASSQLLIDRIKARMATILTTGGYYTNAGQHVSVWKANPFEKATADAIDIREGDETSDSEVTEEEGLERHTTPIELRLITVTSPVDETMRKLIADAKKAIGTDEYWKSSLGVPLALKTEPKGHTIVIDQDKDRVAGATLRIEVTYDTVKWQEA